VLLWFSSVVLLEGTSETQLHAGGIHRTKLTERDQDKSAGLQHTTSTDKGYTFNLVLESKLPEDTVEGLAEENKENFTGSSPSTETRKPGLRRPLQKGIRPSLGGCDDCMQMRERRNAQRHGGTPCESQLNYLTNLQCNDKR